MPVSGSEEGGIQLMQNTENICCVLFVYSWIWGKETHQLWCLLGASDALQKV